MLLTAVLLAACSSPEPPQLSQGTLLPSAKPVTDFQLTDHRGQPFTLENLKDNWTFAFFGYTHCPDVCPTSMTMLAQVQRKLEQRDGLDQLPQVVFVSVDPERDTTALLSQFVPWLYRRQRRSTQHPQTDPSARHPVWQSRGQHCGWLPGRSQCSDYSA
jgi:cytochrome oxidase Cu insertion factor (SCO1/SenC/PrrC family)